MQPVPRRQIMKRTDSAYDVSSDEPARHALRRQRRHGTPVQPDRIVLPSPPWTAPKQ
jgi:hypothetical protein